MSMLFFHRRKIMRVLSKLLDEDYDDDDDDVDYTAHTCRPPGAVSPVIFSALSDTKLWAHLSSVDLEIRSMESWHQIRYMLGYFHRLTAFELTILENLN